MDFSNIKMFFFLGKNVLKLIELLESKVYNIEWYFIENTHKNKRKGI